MARLGFAMLMPAQEGEAGGELQGSGNAAVPEPPMGTTPELYRGALNPAGLTPADAQDHEFTRISTDADVFGPDGTRTSQMPLAPGTFQEMRVMMAQRANPALNFTPGAVYENMDPQKGGAPGSPGGANDYPPETNFITSQGPDGVTRVGAAPPSPLKLSYGWSDYRHDPTFVGMHLKIQWNANPNKPQLNPTPFNTEGPSQNTRYSTPAPFAAGTYIG